MEITDISIQITTVWDESPTAAAVYPNVLYFCPVNLELADDKFTAKGADGINTARAHWKQTFLVDGKWRFVCGAGQTAISSGCGGFRSNEQQSKSTLRGSMALITH